MGRKKRLWKDTDYETAFACGGGSGILREEVWVDAKAEIVRYNFAFLLPHLFYADNGRVLGFDNAHGFHERHFMGNAQVVELESYPDTANRFYREVEAIRRSYEGQGFQRRI